jgi:hypothetical protein
MQTSISIPIPIFDRNFHESRKLNCNISPDYDQE